VVLPDYMFSDRTTIKIKSICSKGSYQITSNNSSLRKIDFQRKINATGTLLIEAKPRFFI